LKTALGNFKIMIFMIIIFYSIAVAFWIIFHSVFYLVNFAVIGSALALGIGLWPVLPADKKHIARKLSQALVGGYMFFGLGVGFVYLGRGVLGPENMQLSGFWFLLLAGVFAAAVMHYTIAKIVGPMLFNRAWCGWACWTAAVLDLLPWRRSPGRLPKRIGALRYVVFALVTATVFILVFGFNYNQQAIAGVVAGVGSGAHERTFASLFLIPEFWWFAVGNAAYFAVGIILAAVLKDNRAFCKYVCPITVFLKAGSRFSLLKIKGNDGACTACGACDKHCPMDIHVSRYVKDGRRVTASECILCLTCVSSCPEKILGTSFGLDCGFRDRLRERKKA
jgi:ferredoxin-type protein NapH